MSGRFQDLAGAEGGPDERAGREGPGQGEAKRRRVEHGQGAAAVSGSPEGGARDEGKEGSSAENDGESGDAGGKERGDEGGEGKDEDEQESEDKTQQVKLRLRVREGGDEAEEIVRAHDKAHVRSRRTSPLPAPARAHERRRILPALIPLHPVPENSGFRTSLSVVVAPAGAERGGER
jgi:hypothetical protein